MEHRPHANQADGLARRFQLLGQHHGQQRDIERVKVDVFTARLVLHQVDGDVRLGEHGVGDGLHQPLGLLTRLVGFGKQVLVDRFDRPCRGQKLALASGNPSLLRQQALDTRPLGLVERVALMRRGWRRFGRNALGHRQGLAITLGLVESNARQPQRLQGDDLLQALDLETGESKGMLGPGHVQLHMQPDAQLRRGDVRFGGGGFFAHGGFTVGASVAWLADATVTASPGGGASISIRPPSAVRKAACTT